MFLAKEALTLIPNVPLLCLSHCYITVNSIRPCSGS